MNITTEKNIKTRTSSLRLPYWKDIAPTAFLFLAGRAGVLGMHPFGVAFFAAAYDKRVGYLGIIAMAAGLISGGSGNGMLKYVLSSVLFWLYTNIFDNDSKFAAPAACALCMLVGGVGCMMYLQGGMSDFMMIAIESILSAFLYVVFGKASTFMQRQSRRSHVSQEELVCLCISLGVIITGLSGIILPFGITLSYCAAAYAVMCIALHTSLASAGCGGLAIGLVSCMDNPAAIVITGIFGIGGMLGNLLKAMGKYGAATGFIGGCIITVLYLGNSFDMPFSISDIVFSTLAFVLTPSFIHSSIGGFFEKSLHMEFVRTDLRVREYITNRLDKAGEAFDNLEKGFKAISERRLKMYQHDAGDIFDEVCDRVCQGCSNWKKCWSGDFRATCRNMLILLDTMESKGVCTMSVLPPRFRERCIRAEMFVIEFNHVYELYKKDQVFKGESKFARDLTASQYGEFARIVRELSDEVRSGFTFMEDVEERVVAGLDSEGIPVHEVSVIENGIGAVEVYLSLDIGARASLIPDCLSEILAIPMEFDKNERGISKYVPKSTLSVDWGISGICRTESQVSGDCAMGFITDDRRFVAVLCDGMGSGPAALKESRMSAALLKQFIEAGISPRLALQIANSALAMKFDKESFSTIDMCCVDLTTGQGEFYKAGACESIIKKGGDAETIYSKAIPAGVMPDAMVKPVRTMLSDGDVVLMVSDGVLDGGVSHQWLKNQLRATIDAKTLSKQIIDGTMKKKGGYTADDMTAVVIRVSETE